MREQWHTALGASASAYWEGVPAVDGGKLFVEDRNNVAALDANTGNVLWSTQVRDFPSPAAQQLLTAGGKVFVSEARDVSALDEQTGQLVWRFTPDSGAAGVFPAVDDIAYYTGQRGIPIVYALARETGTVLWKVNPGTSWQFPAFVSAVRVSGNVVYGVIERWLTQNGGSSSIVVVALDRGDGHELWRFESSNQHDAAWGASLVGELLVINNIVGRGVVAVSTTTHDEKWRFSSPGTAAGGTALPTSSNGNVYIGTGGGFVYALDAASGAVKWQHSAQTVVWGVTVCGNAVVSNIYNLERYDPSNGTVTGHFNASGGALLTSNLVSDGARVFVTGQDGVHSVSCS